MAKGFKHGAGGASGLNFVVVGGLAEPVNPKENTIWVKTDTEITSWIVAPANLNDSPEGRVWIKSSKTGAWLNFNALKSSKKWLTFPSFVGAEQMVGGVYVPKRAYIYMDGAWLDLRNFIYNRGTVNIWNTSGINGTAGTKSLYATGSISPAYNKTYTTQSKVDLTNVSQIHMIVTSSVTAENVYVRALATDTAYDGGRFTAASLIAYKDIASPFNGNETEIVVDVGALRGEYYLGWAVGVSSSASSAVSVTANVFEWWLE